MRNSICGMYLIDLTNWIPSSDLSTPETKSFTLMR